MFRHIYENMSIVRRVFDGSNAEVRYCCTVFSEMYEKRRRDAPGTFRNPAGKIRHLLVNKTSILRRVFAYLRKQRQFYDVFSTVRTLKYSTIARVFFRKCMKNVDETLPQPSGTLRAKYNIYLWKKCQFYDVFLHMYEKRRQFSDVFWHIGRNLVNFTACFDTFSKKM